MSINRFSKIFVPSEYVAPFDLNTYGYIGAQKEAAFGRNLQVLQSGLDQIVANTNLARPADRDAFDKRMAEIVNEINKHGSEDLGDPTVLGSMQQKGKSVYGDPGIITAIGETNRVQAYQRMVDEDQKKNKLSAMNKEEFDLYVADWMKGTDVGKKFTGEYYTHYNYTKPLMDVLAKAQATGEIQRMDPVSGGLQTDMVKVKSLTQAELMATAYKIVGTDPMAQKQMNTDANYLSRRKTNEQVTEEWKQFASTRANDLHNQYLTLEKQRAVEKEAGNTERVAYYDKEMKDLAEEETKYTKWADDENTASTLEMIKGNKDGYHHTIFADNFIRGATSVFKRYDETLTRLTNLDKVMDRKRDEMIALAKYKQELKDGVTGGEFILNLPANDQASNALTESQLQTQIEELNQQDIRAVIRLRDNLIMDEPTLYGKRYNDPATGKAEYEKDYKEMKERYNNGDVTLSKLWTDHFKFIDENNNKRGLKAAIPKAVAEDLLKDANYQRIWEGVYKGINNMGNMAFKDDASQTMFEATGKEAFDMIMARYKGDMINKTIKIPNDKGGFDDFVYQLMPGNSKAALAINAQIETNLQAALKELQGGSLKKKGFLTLGDTARMTSLDLKKFMYEKGVLLPPIIGRKRAAITDLIKGGYIGAALGAGTFIYHGLGTDVDHVFHHNVSLTSQGINRETIDKKLTNNGSYDLFYGAGDKATDIKNSYYNKYATATMHAVKSIDADKKTQDRYINMVRLAQGEDVDDKLVNIRGVGRDILTDNLFWIVDTEKDNTGQKRIPVEKYMEGNTGVVFESNPWRDYEMLLKGMSAGRGGADVAYPPTDNVDEAIAVSGTGKKVRLFWHPDEKMFGYRLYEDGEWLPQKWVESLQQAFGVVNQAKTIQTNANTQRGVVPTTQ